MEVLPVNQHNMYHASVTVKYSILDNIFVNQLFDLSVYKQTQSFWSNTGVFVRSWLRFSPFRRWFRGLMMSPLHAVAGM